VKLVHLVGFIIKKERTSLTVKLTLYTNLKSKFKSLFYVDNVYENINISKAYSVPV